MKKIISLLLALMLICTFCTPAFAAGNKQPVELNVQDDINIDDNGVYIISSGYYEIPNLSVSSGAILIIGRDADLWVTETFVNSGTIIMLGALDVCSSIQQDCCGEIYLFEGCMFLGTYSTDDALRVEPHYFIDGVCVACGAECTHTSFSDGKCNDCGYECTHESCSCDTCGKTFTADNLNTGSTLSEGNLAIITAVAGLAAGMAVMFFIMKKQKPALASGADKNDEE